MKLTRVLPGHRIILPLISFDQGSGWGKNLVEQSGIRVSLDPGEGAGVFIPDEALKELGYHYRKPPKKKEKKPDGKEKSKKRG